MVAFKIMDVRVARAADGTVRAFIDGLGVGSPIVGPVDPLRVGLMLSVFASGRDCYWDDGPRVFTTTLTGFSSPDVSPITRGRVASWDVRIPETAGQKPELFVTLLSADERRQTSGNPAIGWTRIEATQKEFPLLLGMVQSRYCFYDAGELRNTEITEDIR